jgi:hypothetical protein
MSEQRFIHVIHHHLLTEWYEAVKVGEERYSEQYMYETGTLDHVARIRDFAQLRIVSDLVSLKGTWLTEDELSYALALFGRLCRTCDYFKILNYGPEGAIPTVTSQAVRSWAIGKRVALVPVSI